MYVVMEGGNYGNNEVLTDTMFINRSMLMSTKWYASVTMYNTIVGMVTAVKVAINLIIGYPVVHGKYDISLI